MKGTIRNPATVVIFSVITCGIYMFYWLYITECELKAFLGESTDNINPGMDVLLSIICAPYWIYLYYRMGKLLMKCQEQTFMHIEDNSVLYLLLSVFGLSIINIPIIQSNLNTIWEKS